MTPQSIRLCILEVLAGVKPYALPQAQLLAEVNHRVRPALSPAQLRTHLSWLLDRHMVAFLVDPFDPDNADARRWLIKEAGEAALKS